MSDDIKFLDAVARFGREFLQKHPRLADMVETARAGATDPKDVVKEVWKTAAENKGFQSEVERALFDAFKIEPGSTDLAHFPDRQKMLERWGFTDEDLVFQPFEDRPDYKMLHPLLMGMIVELLQYDGDLPELRTGPLPQGGTPAVPVHTHARNPVAVGAMLRRASEEVAFELGAAEEGEQSKIARMVDILPEGGQGVSGLIRQETERGIAVPGYTPGQKAAFRDVEAPTGMQLVQMPFKEKQELAHKALTSTQGRRSTAPVIAQMVLDALVPAVGSVALSEKQDREPTIDVEWAMQIDGGVTERNPNFNFIDTAARSLVIKLQRELKDQEPSGSYELAVVPINAISERRVGWRALLYRS